MNASSASDALAHRAHEEHRPVTPPSTANLILNYFRAQKLLSS
jgi:hypothetical protein